MRNAMRLAVFLLAALGLGSPVQAAVQVVETCTDTIGATIVTWDCELEDLEYELGSTVTFTVSWTVLAGTASFEDFLLRGPAYTPKAKNRMVEGTEPVIEMVVDNGTGGSVTASVTLTSLHPAGKSGLQGTGHYSLRLRVDDDGDGVVADQASGFGLNLHVLDPPEEAAAGSIRTASDDGTVLPATWGAVKSLYRP